jgi:hypothetical protein
MTWESCTYFKGKILLDVLDKLASLSTVRYLVVTEKRSIGRGEVPAVAGRHGNASSTRRRKSKFFWHN